MNRTRGIKIFSLLGAIAAAAVSVLQNDWVQAAGIVAAALSSSSVLGSD